MESSLAPSGLPRIRACLFDMDGLLIDSEDIYTFCTNLILHEYGKPDLPWELKAKLQGRPFPESSAMLQAWAQLPISMEEFREKVRAYQVEHFRGTKTLPGVEDLLNRLAKARANGAITMAVATSSHKRMYAAKTDHLRHVFDIFDKNHIVMGDDGRIAEGRGKPAPDIYLLALEVLNQELPANQQIHPEECLVLEDSIPGCEAGRRAGMQVAWVPHQNLLPIYKGREREVLAGTTGEHVIEDSEGERHSEQQWAKKREELVAAGRTFARVRGKTGEIDDGWGRLYNSLENFPLEWYGIEQD